MAKKVSRFRKLREDAMMSKAELARRSGVSRVYSMNPVTFPIVKNPLCSSSNQTLRLRVSAVKSAYACAICRAMPIRNRASGTRLAEAAGRALMAQRHEARVPA